MVSAPLRRDGLADRRMERGHFWGYSPLRFLITTAAAANAIKAWFAKVQEYPGTTTDDGAEDTGENGEDPEAANGEDETT